MISLQTFLTWSDLLKSNLVRPGDEGMILGIIPNPALIFPPITIKLNFAIHLQKLKINL